MLNTNTKHFLPHFCVQVQCGTSGSNQAGERAGTGRGGSSASSINRILHAAPPSIASCITHPFTFPVAHPRQSGPQQEKHRKAAGWRRKQGFWSFSFFFLISKMNKQKSSTIGAFVLSQVRQIADDPPCRCPNKFCVERQSQGRYRVGEKMLFIRVSWVL